MFLMITRTDPARAEVANSHVRVRIQSDRRFLIDPSAPSTQITIIGTSIRTFVFQDALSNSGITEKTLSNELSSLLAPNSQLWKALDQLFPNSRNRILRLASANEKPLTIMIDDFTGKRDERAPFASYFLREPFQAIGLDISDFSIAYWLPSLAHEFTHALLADQGIESWWEEGLAQMIEAEAGGRQPEMTVRSFELADHLPLQNLLETARPLHKREQYAISYLFASYLHSKCGGWAALRAMTGAQTDRPANRASDLSALAKRLASWVESESKSNQAAAAVKAIQLTPEKITRNGLLRFFYMSLILNTPSYPRYQIPSWGGRLQIRTARFATLPIKKMVAGQASIFEVDARTENEATLRSLGEALDSKLEVYLVQIDKNGDFRIFPREKLTLNLLQASPDRQVMMIFNPTDREISLRKMP